MTTHVIAVLGLGALCGAWVLVQQYFARHDPGAPGVEGQHSCCSSASCDADCASAASCATTGGCGGEHHHG